MMLYVFRYICDVICVMSLLFWYLYVIYVTLPVSDVTCVLLLVCCYIFNVTCE